MCLLHCVLVSLYCAVIMSQGKMEGKWEFERNIGTGGFGLVKLFNNQVGCLTGCCCMCVHMKLEPFNELKTPQ